MKINPHISINNQEQTIKELEKDKEKAGQIFEKLFLEQMIKGMYKTTKPDPEENSVEKDFYQDQMIDILSDKIVESKALNLKEKLFKDLDKTEE